MTARALESEPAAEWVPLSALRMWEQNPRRNDHAVAQVAASISRFGFAAPIVARRANGEIVGGHTRFKAAQSLGLTQVPVRFVDLSEKEARLLALADNRLGEIAEWDNASLHAALETLTSDEAQLVGWTHDETAEIARAALGLNELMNPALPVLGGTLASRFLIAPFSVLNAREGWWQERKRAWIAIGIKSELGRVRELLGNSPSRNDPAFYAKKREVEQRLGRTLTWAEFVREHHDVSLSNPAPGGSPDPLARARGARNPRVSPGGGPMQLDRAPAAWQRTGLPSAAAQARQQQFVNGVLMGSDSGNDPRYYAKKQAVEQRLGRTLTRDEFQRDYYEGPDSYTSGTSIFDPVLCELVYRWFSPVGGAVLDPFAGGSVRGLTAAVLGRQYLGIDLRDEQVQANEVQARIVLAGPEPLRVVVPEPERADEVVTDPTTLTPVQRVGEVWIKRDDLFEFAGARGSKARAGQRIGSAAKGLSVAGSRSAPMISRIARIGEALGIPVRCHVAGSKELSAQERDAVAHGAELVKYRVNYLRTLVAKSRADAAEREGWRHIELGLESDEYIEVNAPQAANVPRDARRVVVCVGSGNGLACVLHGLARAGIDLPVLGVSVGFDPVALLDRRAPADWRARVTLVKSARDFDQRADETSYGGVELDPHYEAKCIPFLQPGDCLYVLARRTVDEGGEQTPVAAPAPEPAPAAAPLAEWQCGIPLASLREVAAVFKQHDAGMIHGAFGATKENQIAEAWSRGSLRLLRVAGRLVGAAIVQRVRASSDVADFTDEVRERVRAGELVVRHLAFLAGHEAAMAGALRSLGDCWVEAWQEHGGDRSVLAALDAELHAVKIRASSEQIGVYWLWGNPSDPHASRPVSPLSVADGHALCRLALPPLDVTPLRAAIERLSPTWADHYSGYNKRHSWSALVLRGYGGLVEFIQKPAEMSKRWRAENAEKLTWEIQDTPLRAVLGEAEALIAAIPGTKHRIRLMRLSARDGELTRHADITDPDAGTRPGELLRIHVPVQTNERVVFHQWRTDGSKERAVMREGEAWSLDTRKPHTAENSGEADRIHLVMDVESSPELLALLRERAPVVEQVAVRAVEVGVATFEDAALPGADAPSETSAAPPRVAPRWIVGDSREIPTLVGSEQFDLAFSCPPYADLEVYSDDARDISTMTYENFLTAYRTIIAAACARLRQDRFAVFVVGDVRDGRGNYRCFVSDTIAAFRDAGLELYNEAVLITSAGSLPVRAGRIFAASRKLGKTHQNVLVFVKGSGAAAARACGTVELDEAFLQQLAAEEAAAEGETPDE